MVVRGANTAYGVLIVTGVGLRAEDFDRTAGRGHANSTDVCAASAKSVGESSNREYVAILCRSLEARESGVAVGAKLCDQAAKECAVVFAESRAILRSSNGRAPNGFRARSSPAQTLLTTKNQAAVSELRRDRRFAAASANGHPFRSRGSEDDRPPMRSP